MSRKIVSALAVLACAAAFGAGIPSSGSAESLDQIKARGYIRIAVANEIPYGYMNFKGQAKGFGPDVARRALKKLGITDIQWTVTQFGSLIPALRAHRVDMVAASQAILPQRCEVVSFSEPNTSYGEGLLVPKGNPKGIHGYGDFVRNHDLKLGIVSGADQTDFAQAVGIPNNQIVFISGNTDAIGALQSHRIDAYAATQLTVARLAKKAPSAEEAEPFKDPVIGGKPVRSWGAFTFRKDDGELLAAFNKSLAEVQKTDWWRKTLSHYGLDEHSIDEVGARSTRELCSAKH